MSLSVALADANVLVPRTLRDYILYSAKAGAFQVHWTQVILDEMSRNLMAKFGFTEADAAELEHRMTIYLPRALVEAGKRDTNTVAKITMDDKDRHVVAAALAARATVIVTDNTRHFPRAWLAERKIELLTAGELLTRLANEHPAELRRAHELTVANSPKTQDAILATLEDQIGKAAAHAVRGAVS